MVRKPARAYSRSNTRARTKAGTGTKTTPFLSRRQTGRNLWRARRLRLPQRHFRSESKDGAGLLQPGVWFGEVTALDGLPRTHDAEAYGSTVLLQVTPADLEELLATDPALSRGLLRLEALRLRMLLTAIESYSIQSLEQRLADRLLMLTVSYGVTSSQGLKIEFHLPQEILAQLIGQPVSTSIKSSRRGSRKASSSNNTGTLRCWIEPGLKTSRACDGCWHARVSAARLLHLLSRTASR